ncbi:hypothetical protein GCM10022221_64960 [Actinocorallia aurea]
MNQPLLSELTTDAATLDPTGRSSAPGIIVQVDAEGRPESARDATGPLRLQVVADDTTVEGLLSDYDVVTAVLYERVVVVLVDSGGAASGVVPQEHLVYALTAQSGMRGGDLFGHDAQIFGEPKNEPIGGSNVRCPSCGHTARYDYIEPGETTCVRCAAVLRPE